MALRVAGLNVQGERNNGDTLTDGSPAMDKLKHGIGRLGADVVVLSDTQGWAQRLGREGVLDALGDLGFRDGLTADLEDERLKPDSGITILSRVALDYSAVLRLYNRNGVLFSAKGKKMVGAYLDDLSEDTRYKQAQALPKEVDAIIGDLNLLHHKKRETRALGGGAMRMALRATPLPDFLREAGNPQARKAVVIKDGIAEMERGKVLRYLEEYGFSDADSTHQPTMPAYRRIPPFLQLDHILVNQRVRASDFKVHREPWAVDISDHYPISAILEV